MLFYNFSAYCTLKDNTHVGSWAQQVTANMEKTLNCSKYNFYNFGLKID